MTSRSPPARPVSDPSTPQAPISAPIGAPGQSPPSGRRAGTLLGLLLLFAVGLGLRLWPIEHGEGVNYLADTHVVRQALGMAKDKDPVPPVGLYSTYPNLLPYALLPIYGVQYTWGRATGAWGGVGEYGMRVLEDPFLAHLPARWLVALFGALTPLVVFAAARRAGLRRGAWMAAWLVASGLLHVHFSVQERPWVPLTFFLALSAWFGARAVDCASRRDLWFSGTAAGLAFATHQGGLVALGIPGIAWLAMGGLGPRALLRRAGAGLCAVALFAAVSLTIGHPYLLVHGPTPTEQVAAGADLEERDLVTIGAGGQRLVLAVSRHTFERLSVALFGYDPLFVLLALAGLPWILARRSLWPMTLFALGWGAFFLTNQNDHVRYLLPLVVLLAPAAGLAWERLGDGAAKRGGAARAAFGALTLLLIAAPSVQALRLGHLLRQTDTRSAAIAHLDAQRASGEWPAVRLGIDAFGPELPLDAESLELLARFRELGARERHRLELYRAGVEPEGPAGFDALHLSALFDYEVRRRSSRLARSEAVQQLGESPDQVLAALDIGAVLLVDRTPADGLPPILIDPGEPAPGWPKLPPLSVAEAPLWVLDPSRGKPARGTKLPTEVDFALLDLWQVSRPGPRMELWEVRR